MTARNPLVLVNGQLRELPAGDTVCQNDLLHPAITGGVQDTTTTTGTGSIALDDTPPAGYTSISTSYTNGQLIDYCVQGGAGEWEVGTGAMAAAGDPMYSDVVLLLKGNGVNGGTTFTDDGPLAFVPTVAGNAQTSTVQSKFGGASIYLDGVSAVRVSGYTAVNIGVGDFTAEAWVRLSSLGALNALFGDILWSGGYQGGWLITITSAGALQLVYDGTGGSWTTINSANSLFTTNTWHHVAVVRHLGIQTVYLDGVSVISFTNTKNYTTGRSFRIGEKFVDGGGQDRCTGYIDDLRVTLAARHTATFTVPTTHPTFDGPVGTGFTRGLVRASSNGGALTNFSAGTKQVFALPHAGDVRNAALGRQYAFSRAFALP